MSASRRHRPYVASEPSGEFLGRQRSLADPVARSGRHPDRIDWMDAVKVSLADFFSDRREGFGLPSVWTVPAFEFAFAPEKTLLHKTKGRCHAGSGLVISLVAR